MNQRATNIGWGLTLVLGGILLFASMFSAQNNRFDETSQWQPVRKVAPVKLVKTNSLNSQRNEMRAKSMNSSQSNHAPGSFVSNGSHPDIAASNAKFHQRKTQSRRGASTSHRNFAGRRLPKANRSEPRREPKKVDRAVGLASYERVINKPRSNVESKRALSRNRGSVQPQQFLKLTSSVEVEQSAIARVHFGKSLAKRGAFFACKEEFTGAMYLVSEAYDRKSGKPTYSGLLRAALLTLDEVENFERSNREGSSKSLEFILSAHRSGLVSAHQAANYTRDQLVMIYLQSAKQQLEHALGNSPAASSSLFAMGKLLAASPNQKTIHSQVSTAIFEAAFRINPHNAENANELGVQFLRTGDLEKAKAMFQWAVQGSDSPVFWNNLAEVHRRMANHSMLPHEKNSQIIFANQAVEQARLAAAGQYRSAGGNGSSNWVSAKQFHDNAAVPDSRIDSPRIGQQPADSSRVNSDLGGDEESRGLFKKIKNWF